VTREDEIALMYLLGILSDVIKTVLIESDLHSQKRVEMGVKRMCRINRRQAVTWRAKK